MLGIEIRLQSIFYLPRSKMKHWVHGRSFYSRFSTLFLLYWKFLLWIWKLMLDEMQILAQMYTKCSMEFFYSLIIISNQFDMCMAFSGGYLLKKKESGHLFLNGAFFKVDTCFWTEVVVLFTISKYIYIYLMYIKRFGKR